MPGYNVLNKFPASAFLDPTNFVSEFDAFGQDNGRAEKQYQEGLRISNNSIAVGVSANGTWWARGKDGSHTTSYEGIGYHANTADLLRGFLAGTATIIVYRYSENGITETVIRP